MTRSDVLRSRGWLATAAVALLGGCASAHHASPMASARPTTGSAVAAVTPALPPVALGWEHVRVLSIDGQGGAFNAQAFGGVSMGAGRHTLLVHLQADWAPFNEAVSDPDVVVTFVAEAGHSYRLDGWPTTVRDTTDRHADGRAYAVEQSTRYTTVEE